MRTDTAYLRDIGHVLAPLRDGDEVNFRLTYDGDLLKAAGGSGKRTRREEKHELRRAFHVQLANLWNSKGLFVDQLRKFEERTFGEKKLTVNSLLTMASEKWQRGKYTCLPIVRSDLHLVCYLEILFLRPGQPGALISEGGELDNRIKTLFDALRMPIDDNEVRDYAPELYEMPFLCLLENDSLITGFRVDSDRLLESKTKPSIPEPYENEPEDVITEVRFWENHPSEHVRLIINVEISATKVTPENMGYFSRF